MIHYLYAGDDDTVIPDWHQAGVQAAPDYRGEIPYGEGFAIPSPVVIGHTASQANVTGQMTDEGMEYTVWYTRNAYPLVVNYVYEDGTEAAPSAAYTLYYNQGFRPITPEIEGYTHETHIPDNAQPGTQVIQSPEGERISGLMPANALTITVVYTAEEEPAYRVEYRLGSEDGEELLEAKVVTGVEYGETYQEEAEEITGYTADAASKEVTVTAGGENRIVFVYTAEEAVVEIIPEEETPLAGGNAWALLNLILTVLTVLGSVLLLVFTLGKKEEEGEGGEGPQEIRKKKFWRIFSIVPAIAAVIAFILTEDMTQPMQFVDKWTILMVAIALIQVVVAILSRKSKRDSDDGNDAAPAQA